MSQELFDRAQKVFSLHDRDKVRERKRPHFLRGIVACGSCGPALSSMVAKGRSSYYPYWRETDAEKAEQELRTLAKQLQADHPGAAASLREGLQETLTVTRLGLSSSLLRTFKSTNPIESMISVARTVSGNVKRWRNGEMILRWTAAGVLEAEKQFRRVNGYRDLQLLRLALKRTSPAETEAVAATG